jgi:hypothetical protein
MSHIAALAAIILFAAGNFYLWGLKQPPAILFWESMGIAAVVFPALFLYVTRSTK